MSGTTVGIAVSAALALIVIVVMRARQRQRSEWAAAATALGMEPLSALDPALTAAIIALHRPPMPDPTTTQTWSLTRIYRYPESGASCYSITVHVDEIRQVLQQGRTIRTESRETRVVAFVAPKSLQAPRMQVVPRAVVDPAAGALARMAVETANAMIDAAAAQGGDRVEFADSGVR